ncbi:anillin isoform X2 [Leptidea sinapis]|uniref:anillin isoform X2 n=1 Tax=Leptidea sinapis TaxID=189913 RepID=UPI0021C2B8FE|nr:anillin isoform X2 [Leptidea sinapis]
MDPFTQRMLERARARQEKIDQKLANSGQAVPKRKPLSENVDVNPKASPGNSPNKIIKQTNSSPKKPFKESNIHDTPVIKRAIEKSAIDSSHKRNDVIVTKKEFKSPKRGSLTRRNSDVSVEINISHRNDIQIEVQVEERDAPISIMYDPSIERGNNVVIEESKIQHHSQAVEMADEKSDRENHRYKFKSRLDRLGNLYSDKPNLSSPIHRTESEFTSATPPSVPQMEVKPANKPDGKKKFGRLAALADQINNWEDDLSHHTYHPESNKPIQKHDDKLESSTLDISIHSINDINKALQKTDKSKTKPTLKAPTHQGQHLNKQIVAELEGDGFRRVSDNQSRLVYNFAPKTHERARQVPSSSTTPSEASAPNMATVVAAPIATVTKKPSIKKYKAPTPPRNDCDDKDKENNVIEREENYNGASVDSIQTKQDKPANSPVVKRFAQLNGNADRNSVLSRAAMFESGSPKSKEKDPAEMSLRERKALFEKNKGTVIVPKAPFGMAPSIKTLQGNRDKPPQKQVQTASNKSSDTSRTGSKDSVAEDNISQSSLVGGIKGKLAALFSKEQTISEATIVNKFKQEREKEMEMLQNRFHYKPKQPSKADDSDDDHSENDPSEKAPLMGSTTSLSQANKKPEIIANVPKVIEKQAEKETEEDKVVGAQPIKRRSSQHDAAVVLSIIDDVKRVKVNNNAKEPNGVVLQQPTSLYPQLSDIDTENTSREDSSDCGGSSEEKTPDKLKRAVDLNKSDNWADTSFGREVMSVVKRNNTSYKKAVQSDSDESGCDSELDDLLDEALQHEGPTPPKMNKGCLSSSSFVYQDKGQFKSPLKNQPLATPVKQDRGNELVHSVSFYRRMQASTTPSSATKVVRHVSPEREPAANDPAANVSTVRQRIKELQAEIAKQQTVISQASQALNLCAATIEFSGSTEQAEGERLLLLATHRRQACLHEVQRLQVEGAGPAATAGMASLHINSIRVPLRRDYIRQLNADGAVGHHAVCLLKCRDRVLASSMQLSEPTAPLAFPDEIRMHGLASDFKVTIEVYLLQASKELLPHNVKYHIFNKKSNSKLLTPKSKVSELKAPRVQSPGGPTVVRSPQFQLHGYCIFALQQANRTTFTLNKVPCGSPLEGSIHMSIAARVRVSAPPPHAAFLTAFDDVSGLGAWHRRWFSLRPPTLSYWKYPDDVPKKMPIGDIDLTTVISEKVTRAPRDLCARPNTLLLETSVPAGLIVADSGSLVYVRGPDGVVRRRHLLAADTPRDRDVWLEILNRALEYVRCCLDDD